MFIYVWVFAVNTFFFCFLILCHSHMEQAGLHSLALAGTNTHNEPWGMLAAELPSTKLFDSLGLRQVAFWVVPICCVPVLTMAFECL